jgi:hypothetical protein
MFFIETIFDPSPLSSGLSIYEEDERGHLVGDVPGLLLIAAVLWFLLPAKQKVANLG